MTEKRGKSERENTMTLKGISTGWDEKNTATKSIYHHAMVKGIKTRTQLAVFFQ